MRVLNAGDNARIGTCHSMVLPTHPQDAVSFDQSIEGPQLDDGLIKRLGASRIAE
jgi:hypothetical protein